MSKIDEELSVVGKHFKSSATSSNSDNIDYNSDGC